MRFDQPLFFFYIWILLFFASCQHCLGYIRARTFFPIFSSPFQTCQSLFTPVGEGCSLGIEAPGVGPWSPCGGSSTGRGGSYSQPAVLITSHIFGWDTGATSTHRIRIVAQINGPWPGNKQIQIKAINTFLATRSAFSYSSACQLIWAGGSLSFHYYMNNNIFCWNYNVYLQLRLLITLWGNSGCKLSPFWFATGYTLLDMNLSSLQRCTIELYKCWIPWLSILQITGIVKIKSKLLMICKPKLWIIFRIAKLKKRTCETSIFCT